jgi:predicted outer membrane repeat protein
MKTQNYFIATTTVVSMAFLLAGIGIAEDFTLSDEGLMMLHVGTYYYTATASITAKRDVPEPGVEYKIHFPGIKPNDSTLEMVCDKFNDTNSPLVGVNVGKYDCFSLKFTLTSINGKTTSDAGGQLYVGAYVGCDERRGGFRPVCIGFGENAEPNAISATRFSGEILSNIGFTVYIGDTNGWDPNGATITLLVEPVLGAVALPKTPEPKPRNITGKVIYVDTAATGSNNGSSWADAFKSLQDALAIAAKGDEIWVAHGTYKPNQGNQQQGRGERAATFMLKSGVAIYGGFPSGGGKWEDSNPLANETILSGDLKDDDVTVNNPAMLLTDPNRSDNAAHVITASGTDETAVLDGFIITGGNSPGGNDRWPKEPLPTEGGGLYCKAGSPTITNCIFKLNSAELGGAVYFWRGTPLFINCRFIDNYAGSSGGAMHNAECNPVLVNCVFTRNSANEKGGAIYNETNKAKIINCTITENYAYAGGGVYNQKSTPIVTNCILWGNTSHYGADEPAQLYGVKVEAGNCCIQGLTEQLGGKNCFAKDPQITDPDTDGYHLSTGSPCIDAGDSKAVPDDVGTDIDGNRRITGVAVDIGAAEAQ